MLDVLCFSIAGALAAFAVWFAFASRHQVPEPGRAALHDRADALSAKLEQRSAELDRHARGS